MLQNISPSLLREGGPARKSWWKGITAVGLLFILSCCVNAQSMRLQDAALGSVVQIGSFNFVKIGENKYMQSTQVTCPDLAKVGNKYVKCYDTYEEAASGGSCACGTGYVFDGSYKSGIGACKLSCGIYSSIDSDNPFSCNCDAGYYVDSSYTKTSYNTIKTSCSYLKCGALSSQTSGNNLSCTCTSGYSVDADWKTTSYTNVGGKCTYLICGEHSYQNTTNVLQCDCESGWATAAGHLSYTDAGNKCTRNQLACGANSYNNEDNYLQCDCKEGYYFPENNNLATSYTQDGGSCMLASSILQPTSTVYDFSSTSVNTWTVPATGYYKLEVWGAQGGYGTGGTALAGYGGYSYGILNLEINQVLAIVIGGKGGDANTSAGYNGGGSGKNYSSLNTGGGGGASHIAIKHGSYTTLSSYNNPTIASQYVLLVAGGGGGGGYAGTDTVAASGGGITGGNGKSCTGNVDTGYTNYGGAQQDNGNGASFGVGKSVTGGGGTTGGGGGGGWYGGGASHCAGGGGGSGYLNISTLIAATYGMYCYNGAAINQYTTCGTGEYSIAGPNVSATATANYAKSGNGYARITLMSVSE